MIRAQLATGDTVHSFAAVVGGADDLLVLLGGQIRGRRCLGVGRLVTASFADLLLIGGRDHRWLQAWRSKYLLMTLLSLQDTFSSRTRAAHL